jgi:hypothetical protein
MCGRFKLKTSPRRIAEMFRLQRLGEFDPRFNIAPSQPVLAVRLEPERGEREATFLKWGLIPSWAKEPGIGNKLANARADTVAAKPAFRSAFKKRRCLVAADGFYEFIWTIPIPLPVRRGPVRSRRAQPRHDNRVCETRIGLPGRLAPRRTGCLINRPFGGTVELPRGGVSEHGLD